LAEILPGSRAVLFSTEHSAQTFDDTDIDVVSLKTGERTTLHDGGFFALYLPSGHLVWVHSPAVGCPHRLLVLAWPEE
jgi:hypothetical protein